MKSGWPSQNYDDWAPTCDTLHAHTQVLGKVAVALAPAEPQLQHAALQLTARGWETLALPAPDRSGAIVCGVDLHAHEIFGEHTDGRSVRIPLTPDRPVGEVTVEFLGALGSLAGEVRINSTPQEVPWSVPLDQDIEHATYDRGAVELFHSISARVALALAEFRAPFRGRATPVNAWWGSFDLAVNLHSGASADPPSDDFIMRNAMDVQEFAIGWWPGYPSYSRSAMYAYAHPAPDGFAEAELAPDAAHWDSTLGEFVLDLDDIIASPDPHAEVLNFARSAFRHTCTICSWDPDLLASAEGSPPPIR